MAIAGGGISHVTMPHRDFQKPWYLASGIKQTDIGKPVTLDTSGSYKMKLAGDGDPIMGVLLSVEDRSQESSGLLVGTVASKGVFKMTMKTGDTAAVGDEVVGAGSGEVKKLAPYVDTDGTGSPVVTATSIQKSNRVIYKSGKTLHVELL